MNQLLDIFQRCVARINVDGVEDQGTGFFVAPGLLLTCAHVIKSCFDHTGTRIGNRAIKVTWERKIFEHVTIKEYWSNSYPDLALLEVPIKGHPCVLLEDWFQPTDKLYCYGYPYNSKEVRAEGMQPDAEGPRDVVRAEETEEYIKFKAAQTLPGFSGGPLLNLTRGTVCGIVKSSRNVDSDLGGFAIRSKVILNYIPYLKEAQEGYHRKNNEWVSAIRIREAQQHFQDDVSANILHSLTAKLIEAQIKAVGQDKYIPDIYTSRGAEEKIEEFIGFEEIFYHRLGVIIDQLNRISRDYGLEQAVALLDSEVRSRIMGAKDRAGLQLTTNELKRAFHFYEVEETINLINSSIQESSPIQHDLLLRNIRTRLDSYTFIKKAACDGIEETLYELRRRAAITRGNPFDSEAYWEILKAFPSDSVSIVRGVESSKVLLANDLLKEIDLLASRSAKRCLALVGKAGNGKTNTVCRLAEQIAKDQPVILLSGQMEISTEYDIEFHIQRRLETEIGGNLTDWMNRINPGLETAHKWLFILVDGINESNNLQLFIRILKYFLSKIEGKRVKLILSCRDLFWDLFSAQLKPYLFDDDIVLLGEFTESEWDQAVSLYFKRFDIECRIDENTKLALKNPLLLRFFCEAYRGKRLGEVNNLRLLSIFDLYIERISDNISQRLGLLKPDAIEHFLIKAAHEMWGNKTATANLSILGVTPQDSSEIASVYNAIRSENVILEETFHLYSKQKVVRFLYDEFMEYMLARSWMDEIYGSKVPEDSLRSITEEAVDAIVTYQPAFGAILFLDKMDNQNGNIVKAAIKRIMRAEKNFMESRQIFIAYAFESIPFDSMDQDLILILEEFERMARDEIKERLAPIILGVLKENQDHQAMKALVNRILEVGPRETVNVPVVGKNVLENPDAVGPTESQSVLSSGTVPLLPPGRYHYTEETKLNAISILVGSKSVENYKIVEEGIRNLGRMDLHSALQALAGLDFAADDFVYKSISGYLKVNLPEYHIYCAWLLRERYGIEPAQFLSQLLMSEETRVHQYTFSLFDRRLVEAQLLDQVLSKIQALESIRPWHLTNLVRLLGRRSRLLSPNLDGVYGQKIVTVLERLYDYTQSSVRLEVYRAVMNYSEFVDVSALLDRMQHDEDIYIKSFAQRIIS